jgi:hypothetical protein
MSEIKVNKISPRTACGTTTLGDTGDTFTIPAGVTITNSGTAAGFGATGAASWDTTVKTSGFTAVSGVGYFVNTTAGVISVNLPAGTAGDVVAIKDYAKTFDTNAVTLVQNGSDKIGGSTENGILNTEGIAVTLVFIDSTQGWLVTDSGLQNEAPTGIFLTATGGTITTSGNCKIHTFTGPGTFAVTELASTPTNNVAAYMVVAGGAGGGGASRGGGGGAGGFREGTTAPIVPYTASPLVAPTGITVTLSSFPITVGAGGANGTNAADGGQGNDSTFSTITSAGGGQGRGNPGVAGGSGGSGGGGAGEGGPAAGGTGNTPPVSPAQGTNGGAARVAPLQAGGGGGGATVAGQDGQSPYTGGAGGAGATTEINASPTAFAGGGGGGGNGGAPFRGGAGGTGGGGAGGGQPSPGNNSGSAGTTNTGGGGGGGANPTCNPLGLGSAGGSGIVIIRYKFQ